MPEAVLEIPEEHARTRTEEGTTIGHTLERGGEEPVPSTKPKLVDITELEDMILALLKHNVYPWEIDPKEESADYCDCDSAEDTWWRYLEGKSMPWSFIRKEYMNDETIQEHQ